MTRAYVAMQATFRAFRSESSNTLIRIRLVFSVSGIGYLQHELRGANSQMFFFPRSIKYFTMRDSGAARRRMDKKDTC